LSLRTDREGGRETYVRTCLFGAPQPKKPQKIKWGVLLPYITTFDPGIEG